MLRMYISRDVGWCFGCFAHEHVFGHTGYRIKI